MKMQIGGYTRNVVVGNWFTEVTITWPPGTRTPSHDHNTHAWVFVLKGCVFEISGGEKIYHRTGEYFGEGLGKNGGRHIVGNDSDEDAITCHMYGGPLIMNDFPDDPSEIAAFKTTAEV